MYTVAEIVKQYLNTCRMTSLLKVECSSHCTTPSERHEDYPVTVKVGCFHVNPATPRGRQKFFIHMLILCFVPHAALIIQNSTIMAQLSQTLDSALYLNSEVETILALEELILSLQEERQQGADILFQDARSQMNRSIERAFSATDVYFDKILPSIVKDTLKITLYHFRNDLTNFIDLQKENSYKRMSVYEEINSVLLLYAAHRVKLTSNVLWRQLLATNTLLKSMEEISLALTSLTFHMYSKNEDSLRIYFIHQYSAIDHLVSTAQYIEVEKLAQSGRIIQKIIDFYKPVSWKISAKIEGNIQINSTRAYLVQLHDVHEDFVTLIRDSVLVEVWRARWTLAVGVIILLLVLLASPLLVLLLRHIIYTIETFTHSIELTTQRLTAEKQKSDMLLSRMLPLPVLKRLRAQRTVPAESFDAVTIFFSDIVGFTTISATSTPMEVINMLNMLYRLFDEKLLQYNVYKVETIGDAYMVVSGLPQRNGNRHASEIADMSLSLMRSLEGATVPHRPHEALRVRAGVNTGPCVAGVVGTTMPRYCLFGDTINTASRMESTGEALKIHISYSTKKALDEIGNYETVSRGILDVAGKGNMETFWLVGKVGGLQAESPRCRLNDYDQNLLEILIKQ